MICGFAAIFGAVAPAGAATESFTITSASLPGQSSVTWQGPPLTGTPNVFPSTVSLSGQIDSSSGDISGATLSLPPLPQPEQQGENTTFTFSEVNPGTATGNFNATTGAVTLNDSLKLTFTGTGLAAITCVTQPINVALSGTWDPGTQDVTLATTTSFTIPQFQADSGPGCGAAAPSLNASPGGVTGSVGNAMSLGLNGQFAPGLPTTTTLSASPNSPQLAGTSVTLTAVVADPSAQGTPTGNVTFYANGADLGTSALDGTGTAALTTSTLPQAADQLTAVYAGDTSYAGSTSNTVPYTVQALPTVSSTFPSQFTAGTTAFPTPTPFTVTVANPAGGASYDNNLFLYLGIASFRGNAGLKAADIQLAYEDQSDNWCPVTLTTKAGGGFKIALGTFFDGFGTPPCGFGSGFSLDPGSSFTLNMQVAFASANNYAGPVSLGVGLQTGTCVSSSSCTAAAPLKSGVNAQAAATVVPQTGPGTVPSAVTPVTGVNGFSSTIRSGYDQWLAATVQPATASNYLGSPTGSVQFVIDGSPVETTTLPANPANNNTATAPALPYNVGPLVPGTHTETINYSGDLVYAPSSVDVTFTVIAGPPPGTLYVCSVSASIIGGALHNFDAYVTATGAGIPTAAFSGSSVTTSDVSVTLDLDHAGAGGGGAAALNLAQANQSITFSPGSEQVSAGTATFVDATPPTDTVGTWSGLSVTTTVTGDPGEVVPIGVGSISFTFGANGSASCTPASQDAVVGSVAIIGTTLAANPSGSAAGGAPVTLTATTAPLPPAANISNQTAQPPGQVDFYDGSTYLATASVSSGGAGQPPAGTASFTTSDLSVGDHQLTAIWSGYGGVPANTSNTVDYTVGTATTTSLASSANPANATTPITYTATVSPPPGATTMPTGDVSFTSDGNPIASCQNVALSMATPPTATCVVNMGAGQSHSIVATYSGDATYIGSVSDTLTQTTLPGTNTTILSTKDPSPPGNVTFWAGVSPSSGKGATPTGTVAFSVDGATYKACSAQPLGPGGGASCTVSFKAGTTHKVFATYPGSSSYSGSKSSTITQSVTGAKSSTTPRDTGGSATLNPGQSLTASQSISAGGYELVMQSDGNLVEYQGSKALWASGTSGHSGTGAVMQKDGNLVIYSQGRAIWASKTSGHPGAHLTLQGADGNVVIYGPGGQALWATGT